MLLLLLAACDADPAPCAEGFVRDDAGNCTLDAGEDTAASSDTATDWTTLPAECSAPSDLGDDPVTLTDSVLPGEHGGLYEMVDIELSGGLAYAVGQGGLVILDPTPGAASVLGSGVGDRFHRVEPIGEGYVALTHRDRGLTIADVSDPTRPVQVASVSGSGWEGMAYADGRLYVTVRDEGVRVLDVTDPASPGTVGEGAGLSAPWELSKPSDGWIYAADNTLGVVPIDISDPDALVIGDPVDLGSAVLHVTLDGDHLYAAAGGAGVVVLDLADPARPEPVVTLPTGGSVVMTAVADDLLYGADHTGLVVWDVSDPSAPIPVGREETPQFALGVAAADDIAWIADWTALEGWAVDRDAGSPEVEISSMTVLLSADGGTTEIELANLGGGDLHLLGATTSDDRLAVEATADTLAPGETATLRLTFAGDGEDLDATVCLATDDPDGPLVVLDVGTGSDDPYVGLAAPDFALPGIDGETYRLSEQLGHPVMLVYFATW